jgi:hypothetical protein
MHRAAYLAGYVKHSFSRLARKRINRPIPVIRRGNMKKEISVTVFKEYLKDGLFTKSDKLIKFIQEKVNFVPEEYRDTARIHIYIETDDYNFLSNSGRLVFEVICRRLEFDKEYEDRLAMEKPNREWKENQELCQLEKLKEKYGV